MVKLLMIAFCLGVVFVFAPMFALALMILMILTRRK